MKREVILLSLTAVLAVGAAFAGARRGPGNSASQRQSLPQTTVCCDSATYCVQECTGNCPQQCPKIKGGTACNDKICTARHGCDQPRRQACDRRNGGGRRGCRR